MTLRVSNAFWKQGSGKGISNGHARNLTGLAVLKVWAVQGSTRQLFLKQNMQN
jgi:hypothetical protein